MLLIRKHFRLGINPDDIPEIEEKLKEFNVHIIKRTDYRKTINDKWPVEKEYYFCSAIDSDIGRLTTYLNEEYDGIATITFGTLF